VATSATVLATSLAAHGSGAANAEGVAGPVSATTPMPQAAAAQAAGSPKRRAQRTLGVVLGVVLRVVIAFFEFKTGEFKTGEFKTNS